MFVNPKIFLKSPIFQLSEMLNTNFHFLQFYNNPEDVHKIRKKK